MPQMIGKKAGAALMLGLALAALALSGDVGLADARGDEGIGAASDDSKPRRFESLDPTSYRIKRGRAEIALPRQTVAELTLKAGLQKRIQNLLRYHRVPYAAAVALDPKTGRTLLYATHVQDDAKVKDFARDVSSPAASIFKVITASALVDAGVKPEQRVCYGGGMRGLTLADLKDNKKRDRWCAKFSTAMGSSINAIFAKLSDRHLDQEKLSHYIDAFGFNQRLPFDLPTKPSFAEIPSDRLERARTSAGFWHSHLSAVHGALIAATIANDGKMPRAAIVDRVRNSEGQLTHEFKPSTYRPVISKATADAVASMMERTVTHGTSRRTFHNKKGRRIVPGVRIAGKTGTLSRYNPYKGYTWWIGFAPVEDPQIAVATVVVNPPKWRIKANHVAREIMKAYFNK